MEEIGLSKTGRTVFAAAAGEIIVEEGRIRQEFDRVALQELQDSIKDKGQLQAGICRRGEEGAIVLVAGERRLRACSALGIPYEFVLTEERDPLRIRQIELEENIKRMDLTWQEKVDAVDDFHSLQQEINAPEGETRAIGGHTVADTAELLGKSTGIVSEDLELAQFMQLEEVREAKNKTAAKAVVKRLKEDWARAKALKEAQALEVEGEEEAEEAETLPEQESGLDEQELKLAKEKRRLLKLVNFFSERVHEGAMEEVLETWPDGHFELVLFDPPWGQELSEVENSAEGSKIDFEDSHELFAKKLPKWLGILFRKMNENSHLYMFFPMKEHGFVHENLERAGFETNWLPLIWHKQGTHRTRNPRKWPGRSYEPIAFGLKGKKPLQWLGAPDVILTPGPTATMKGPHRSGKHPDVYIELLKRSAYPGDKILDPMCGTGMCGVAAETLRASHQLDLTLIELKEEFVRLSIGNLVKGYSNILLKGGIATQEELPYWYCEACGRSGLAEDKLPGGICSCGGGLVESELLLPQDFKEIPLDGEETSRRLWKLYWQVHPKKQEEMLKWKAENSS